MNQSNRLKVPRLKIASRRLDPIPKRMPGAADLRKESPKKIKFYRILKKCLTQLSTHKKTLA
jgi:hypothetical protein